MLHRRTFLHSLSLLPLGFFLGCTQRSPEERDSVKIDKECDYLLSLLVDRSGSYAGHMERGKGRAYHFSMNLVDRFFRSRIGNEDRILLSQLSGTNEAVRFDGSPRSLRQTFASAEEFDQALAGSPHASRLYHGIADSLDYVLDLPTVRQGRTKVATFVMSDMLDNVDTEAGEKRLLESLAGFKNVGGIVGFYWVHLNQVAYWRRHLQTIGLPHVVESHIRVDPPIPRFDD